MTRNKLVIVLFGLLIGFIGSFLWTKNYNARGVSPVSAASGTGRNDTSSVGNQRAMVSAVREKIDVAAKNPKDFKAQVEVASLFDQIGRTREAIDYMEKAYEINPAEAMKLNIPAYAGGWFSEQKDYVEAEKWFRRALQQEPNNEEVMLELGVSLIQREPPQADKGLQYVQSVLKINPKNTHALIHQVQGYLIKKDARAAEAALQKLKELNAQGKSVTELEAQVENLKAGRPVVIPKD